MANYRVEDVNGYFVGLRIGEFLMITPEEREKRYVRVLEWKKKHEQYFMLLVSTSLLFA